MKTSKTNSEGTLPELFETHVYKIGETPEEIKEVEGISSSYRLLQGYLLPQEVKDTFTKREEEYISRTGAGEDLKTPLRECLPENSTIQEEAFIFACIASAITYDGIFSKGKGKEAERIIKEFAPRVREDGVEANLRATAWHCISAEIGYNKAQEEKGNTEKEIREKLKIAPSISKYKSPKGILDKAMILPPKFYSWGQAFACLLEKQSLVFRPDGEKSIQNAGITPALGTAEAPLLQTAYINNIPVIEFNIETLIRIRKKDPGYKIGGKDYAEPEEFLQLLEENFRISVPSGRKGENGEELFDDLPLVYKQRTAKNGSVRGAKVLLPEAFRTEFGFNNAPLSAIPDKDPSELEKRIICYFQKRQGKYNGEERRSETLYIEDILSAIRGMDIPHYKNNGKKKLKADFLSALEAIKRREFPFVDFSIIDGEKVRIIYKKKKEGKGSE